MGGHTVRQGQGRTPLRVAPVWLASAIIGVAGIMTGCSSASAPDTGIPPQDEALVAAGGVLYQANCAECHGSDLRGTDKGPSHLSIVYEPGHHSDAAFALAVYNGVRQHHWPFGDMPPAEGLDDDDIARIVAFVRENQRVSGFEPYPP